jgi:zinc finger HIT domain-containing protein 1
MLKYYEIYLPWIERIIATCQYLSLQGRKTIQDVVGSICPGCIKEIRAWLTYMLASQSKPTPGVRKILLSQKTFANHLADYEALSSLPQPSTPIIRTPTPSTPLLTSTLKRSHKKKDLNAPPPQRIPSPLTISTPSPAPKHEIPLSMGSATYPPSHPRDNDPLLVSRIPAVPSDEELEKLLEIKPLSYIEAKGGWTEEDRRKPVRRFCEVCGYWGRVRCGRCGGRVCALECLGTHQEECFTRYGA